MQTIKILNWNIGGSNYDRFVNQIRAINLLSPDVLVLTEVRNLSIDKIIQLLNINGYSSFYNKNFIDNYCVMISIKRKYRSCEIDDLHSNISSRNCIVAMDINNISINIVGTYFPSNDRKKIDKKKRHSLELINIINNIDGTVILCGDFNSVYKNHIPKLSWFRQWEYAIFDEIESLGYKNVAKLCNSENLYTWYGNSGKGHTYDYIFIKNMDETYKFYIEAKEELLKRGLSDHLGLMFTLGINE